MTSALPVQPGTSPRTMVIYVVLSLILHAGLLAGLSMIQKSEPIIETVSLVNVTLVPSEISTETKASEKATDPVSPPLRTAPRSSPPLPISLPTQPMVSQPQPITTTSELKLTATPPTLETLNLKPPKRILKDTLASDALLAQSVTKMVKRSMASDMLPLSESNVPSMRVTKIPTRRSLSPSIKSINAAPATSRPTRKRRLTAQPPTTSVSGIAKIGVRHSVPPVYPRMAKEEGWEGIVLLRVLVQSSGEPGEITIQKSSGHKILDDSAIEAIRQWRFTPAMDGNFPVEKYLHVPLNFGLHR